MPHVNVIKRKPNNDFQAVVSVDVDPLAEVCTVFTRGSIIALGSKPAVSIVNFRVPLVYSTINNLTVCIFDAEREYNAEIIDGIQAELIDGNLVTI